MILLIDESGIIQGFILEVSDIKEESENFLRCFGNGFLVPYFSHLSIENRNSHTDQSLFMFFNYLISHYEKYRNEMTFENKRNLFFNICRSVSFLDWQVITGKSEKGIADQYTIDSIEGFKENNLFRDLKFLQILTSYNKPHSYSPDFHGRATEIEVEFLIFDMIHALKLAFKTEGDALITDEMREDVRQKFQSVNTYSHIFSIASYYREMLRCQDALKALDASISILEQIVNRNIFYEKHDLAFMIFRVISVVGEFASQKNMSKQTRLDFPELVVELEMIKGLTNLLVKPKEYADAFSEIINLDIQFAALIWDFRYLRSGLHEILVKLKSFQDNYEIRLKYYTTFPNKAYLSEEIIEYLEGFCGYYFSYIQGSDLQKLQCFFRSSERQQNYIRTIIDVAKEIYTQDEFTEIMTICHTVKSDLTETIKEYTPPALPAGGLLTEIQNIFDFIKTKICTDDQQILRQEVDSFRAFLGNNLLSVGEFDDAPRYLNYHSLSVDHDHILIYFTAEEYIAIPILENQREELIYLCRNINDYSKKKNSYKIMMPKTQGFSDQEKNEKILDSIIQMGKMAKLLLFLTEDDTKLVTEFYLKTLYKLADRDNIEHSKEFRALRDGIRHFEDNLYVTEFETDIEGIYANYIYKTLEQDAFNTVICFGLTPDTGHVI